MSAPWVPPRPASYLRIFAVSIVLVVLCLAAFLFGVQMEVTAPATGTITARNLQEVRSLLPGLIEPGWYEGEIRSSDGEPLRVRLDSQGDGITGPAQGQSLRVSRYEAQAGNQRLRLSPEDVRFHRLQPGDELWAGQVIAAIRADDWRLQLRQVEERLQQWQSNGNHQAERNRARAERDSLRHQLAQAVLQVPNSAALWLTLQVRVAPLQAVQPGDVLAAIVPLDAETHQPRDLIAHLELDEKDCGDVTPGQTVRLFSPVYNQRLHGHAEARIERLEPWGEAAPDGQRRFRAVAPVTTAPFPLPLGSSVKAEVVLGRKRVYRIILEH